MAVIPNVAELPRRIPTGDQPVATVRNAGAIGDAVADLGLSSALAAQDYQDRRTARETSSATTGFALDLFEHGNSYDQSEDWSGMVEDFDGKSANLLSKHADAIGDSRARARFLELGNLRIAEKREEIKDKAFLVEKDFKRAETQGYLDRLREMVILGRGEEAIALAETQLVSDAQMNYITEQERVTFLETFKQDSVKAWIQTQPPKKRVDLLNSSIATNNLPSDYRAIELREAEQAALATKADDIVQQYMDDGISRAEMIDKSDAIEDVELQDEVKRRYNNSLSDLGAAEVERQSELFSEYYFPVLNGEMSVDEISREDIDAMSPAQQNSLVVAEGQTHGRTPKVSDWSVIDQLHWLNETQQWTELRKFYIANVNSLNASDRNTWSQRSVDGVVPDEYESLLTTQQMARVKIQSAGIQGKQAEEAESRVTSKLADWNRRIYSQTGKVPSDQMIEEKIDNLLLEVVTDYRWWNIIDNKDRVYEMSASGVRDAVLKARDKDPARYDRLRKQFPDIDPDTKPVDFLRAFQDGTF